MDQVIDKTTRDHFAPLSIKQREFYVNPKDSKNLRQRLSDDHISKIDSDGKPIKFGKLYYNEVRAIYEAEDSPMKQLSKMADKSQPTFPRPLRGR